MIMKTKITAICIIAMGLFSFAIPNTTTVTKNAISMTQDDIIIEGVGVVKTIDTTGKENIKIEGTNNKITLNGDCESIKIEGVDNIVVVNGVKTVTIEGTGNKVSYKKATGSDAKVKTSVSGVNNKITKIE